MLHLLSFTVYDLCILSNAQDKATSSFQGETQHFNIQGPQARRKQPFQARRPGGAENATPAPAPMGATARNASYQPSSLLQSASAARAPLGPPSPESNHGAPHERTVPHRPAPSAGGRAFLVRTTLPSTARQAEMQQRGSRRIQPAASLLTQISTLKASCHTEKCACVKQRR